MSLSADIFTAEKAGFRERIAALIGGTTYREPVGGRSTDPNRMTDQVVAAAQSPHQAWYAPAISSDGRCGDWMARKVGA